MNTHVEFDIHLECKKCGYKNEKTIVLKVDSSCYIGCSVCRKSTLRFVVSPYAAWSSTSSDLDVRIRKH